MAQDAGRRTHAGDSTQHEVPGGGSTAGPGAARAVAPAGAIDVPAALRAWLPGRRWFPAKGTDATFELVARIPLPCPPAPAPEVFIDVLRALGAGPDGAHVTLQVPLVLETAGPGPQGPGSPAGLIAESGATRLYDGAYHPAFVAAWLGAATWSQTAPSAQVPFDLREMHVLTGEQSNTSIMLPHVAGGAMLKVLRSLAPGQNPDLVVPLALTRVGWSGVPAPYAWNELLVPDDASPDRPASAAAHTWTAHAGVLAELVTGASDGFELACDLARRDQPFDDLARDLGGRVAGMHAALRAAFPDDLTPADVTWLLAALRRRVRTAVASSAAVGSRSGQIEAFLVHLCTVADDAVRHGRPLPPVQRIHGDLHLGQALHSARTGWRILDFEGEPLRPLRERTRPDLGERDVAGMLRSFDYASAVGGAASPAWASGARRGFLAGYYGDGSLPVDPTSSTNPTGPASPTDEPAPTDPSLADRAVVLDAFELDKALYEVVYEERNRPDWITIPLSAVDRILQAHLAGTAPHPNDPDDR